MSFTFVVVCVYNVLLGLLVSEIGDRLHIAGKWQIAAILWLDLALYAMVYQVLFICIIGGCASVNICSFQGLFICP